MRLVRGYVWFLLVMSVVFGGIYLVAPEVIIHPMGIEATSAAGLTDIRATYGGFQLAMAGFLFWCLQDESRLSTGLVAFAFLVGGLAACRSVGLVLDGLTGEMAAAAVMELGLTVFTLFVRGKLEAEGVAA